MYQWLWFDYEQLWLRKLLKLRSFPVIFAFKILMWFIIIILSREIKRNHKSSLYISIQCARDFPLKRMKNCFLKCRKIFHRKNISQEILLKNMKNHNFMFIFHRNKTHKVQHIFVILLLLTFLKKTLEIRLLLC